MQATDARLQHLESGRAAATARQESARLTAKDEEQGTAMAQEERKQAQYGASCSGRLDPDTKAAQPATLDSPLTRSPQRLTLKPDSLFERAGPQPLHQASCLKHKAQLETPSVLRLPAPGLAETGQHRASGSRHFQAVFRICKTFHPFADLCVAGVNITVDFKAQVRGCIGVFLPVWRPGIGAPGVAASRADVRN